MKIFSIFFSPTGGTEKTADILCQRLQECYGEIIDKPVIAVDLAVRECNLESLEIMPEDICVISVPSYGGRVPLLAVEKLKKIRGNGNRAIIVCTYGNRAYEDTFTELYDLTDEIGMIPVAAIASVCEHSIAREFGTGRPDMQDIANLNDFALKIHEKLSKSEKNKKFFGKAKNENKLFVPGNRPYKEFKPMPVIPVTDDNCVSCSLCADVCPAEAINSKNPSEINVDRCISCMRCVSVCPAGFKEVPEGILDYLKKHIGEQCRMRKEAELFI